MADRPSQDDTSVHLPKSHITFPYRQIIPRGVSYRSGHPWDDCPYTKSNANTFVCAHAYRVFLTSCRDEPRGHPSGTSLGNIPRGLRHSRDVPLVDPSTLGRKTLYELAYLKYCHNARVQHRSVKAVTCRLLIDFRH